jgi:hypothetical protein
MNSSFAFLKAISPTKKTLSFLGILPYASYEWDI